MISSVPFCPYHFASYHCVLESSYSVEERECLEMAWGGYRNVISISKEKSSRCRRTTADYSIKKLKFTLFQFLIRTGSTFHPRPYPETTASLFTTICSAFTSGNFKHFGRRMVKVNQKQYGGKQRNKETSGSLLNSQSTSTLMKRLDRRLQLCIRSRLICIR